MSSSRPNPSSSDSDADEGLSPSPSKSRAAHPVKRTHTHQQPSTNTHATLLTPQERKEAREASLRAELASVRQVNEAIEGAIDSLAKAKDSMKVTYLPTPKFFLLSS